MSTLDITLPDGSIRQVPTGSSIADLAVQIGPGLAKAAVAGKIDGELKDLSARLEKSARVQIITLKDPEGLEILRHSASHLMAAAVKSLYPSAQVTIGPAVEGGFYYDFDLENPLGEQELAAVEARMKELIQKGDPFERTDMDSVEAQRLFESMSEMYKAEIIRDLGQGRVSLYRVGGFLDLCRGPHLPSSDKVPAFKVLHTAGAYWRGDEKNRMLTRVYGTAFPSQKELDQHLVRLEEAKKRDHRRLGKELDLFSFHEEAGPGLAYWHPKGAMIRQLIENFWREEHYKNGYEFVVSPHIGKADLWRTSGHLDFYQESMYSPMDIDGQEYFVKPMNCPFHILIYKTQTRSYRDLPVRYAELGTVYRYERSGALHGMLRVRGFTQDDSHIFMREDQLVDEVSRTLEFVFFMLRTFQFKEFEVYVSTRPTESIGEDGLWEKATGALIEAIKKTGLPYAIDEGGGAFYGPKIDIKIKDSIGRSWQCSTLQVDFALPERFDMHYIGDDGARKRPVMLHRALLGSMERFFAMLVEHYSGSFPLWLAPVQARILGITNEQDGAVSALVAELRAMGLRAESDLSSEKIGAKIRDSQIAKIHYTLVLGKREVESGQVTVRTFGSVDTVTMSVEEFIQKALDDVRLRS